MKETKKLINACRTLSSARRKWSGSVRWCGLEEIFDSIKEIEKILSSDELMKEILEVK